MKIILFELFFIISMITCSPLLQKNDLNYLNAVQILEKFPLIDG